MFVCSLQITTTPTKPQTYIARRPGWSSSRLFLPTPCQLPLAHYHFITKVTNLHRMTTWVIFLLSVFACSLPITTTPQTYIAWRPGWFSSWACLPAPYPLPLHHKLTSHDNLGDFPPERVCLLLIHYHYTTNLHRMTTWVIFLLSVFVCSLSGNKLTSHDDQSDFPPERVCLLLVG